MSSSTTSRKGRTARIAADCIPGQLSAPRECRQGTQEVLV
jgi:hypothetical protein